MMRSLKDYEKYFDLIVNSFRKVDAESRTYIWPDGNVQRACQCLQDYGSLTLNFSVMHI
jgi:hypothetical protein